MPEIKRYKKTDETKFCDGLTPKEIGWHVLERGFGWGFISLLFLVPGMLGYVSGVDSTGVLLIGTPILAVGLVLTLIGLLALKGIPGPATVLLNYHMNEWCDEIESPLEESNDDRIEGKSMADIKSDS